MISWPLSGLGGAEKAALMQDGGCFGVFTDSLGASGGTD